MGLLSTATLFAGESGQIYDNSRVIKFSHSKHINDVRAECTDCHAAAASSSTTTDYLLPTMSTCYTCHDQSTTKCEFCHTPTDSTTYQNLIHISSGVIFSHKQHKDILKLNCETCHSGINKVAYAEDAPNKSLPKMEQCTVCHGQGETNYTAKIILVSTTEAPSACETCHKDLANLVPASHRQVNWMSRHKEFVGLSGPQNGCKSCHTVASCQECHDASNLAKDISSRQLYVPSTPSLSPLTTHKHTTAEKVHPEDFRFTHSIKASGRASTCYTCHDERTFCVQCHNSESNGVMIKPTWHNGGGFITNGVGSGGGRHAQYARKDIESCASCHDVQGVDPICISCHTDPDGIKGDDPRTHPIKFMQFGPPGSFHNDPGAICYTCHTGPNAHPSGKSGIGFCGYCHGHK